MLQSTLPLTTGGRESTYSIERGGGYVTRQAYSVQVNMFWYRYCQVFRIDRYLLLKQFRFRWLQTTPYWGVHSREGTERIQP